VPTGEIDGYKKAGLTSIGLAHLTRSDAAYRVAANAGKTGAPKLGHTLIEEMEAVRLIVDLAHVASRCFVDAVEFCKRPRSFPTRGFRASNRCGETSPTSRPSASQKKGGDGSDFLPGYLTRTRDRSIEVVLENIRHLRRLVGDDFIALGSDFDGWVASMPRELRDVSYMPRLTDRMLREGIPIDSIRKILGGNALRVIREVCDGAPVSEGKRLI